MTEEKKTVIDQQDAKQAKSVGLIHVLGWGMALVVIAFVLIYWVGAMTTT